MARPRAPIALVRDAVDSFQLALLTGVRSVLDPLGVPLLEHLARFDGDQELSSLRRVLDPGRVAGVIVPPCRTSPPDGPLALALRETGDLPKVFLLQADLTGHGSTVRGDNAMGVRLLAEHLVHGCGARRMLAVRGIVHHPDSVARERMLRAELGALGVELPADQVVTGDFSREASYRAVSAALRGGRHPDAVVCFNDQSAIGALHAVRDAGLRVPQDVVVTGFDDDEFASLVRPALTTVDQDLAGQGARAARLLLELIDGAPQQHVSHPVRLLRRASSDRRVPSAPPSVPPSVLPSVPAVPVDDSGARAWEYVWNAMVSMDTMLEVSRALLTCRSLDQLLTVLAAETERLQAQRAFLVLRQDDPEPDPGAAAPLPARAARGVVRFARHDGAVRDVSAEARPGRRDRPPPRCGARRRARTTGRPTGRRSRWAQPRPGSRKADARAPARAGPGPRARSPVTPGAGPPGPAPRRAGRRGARRAPGRGCS